MVNPRDIAWNAKEEEEKKNGESQRYSWERRRRIVKPRDIAGNAEEEEEW